MAELFARRRRFLRDYAKKWLPADATEVVIEDTLDRVTDTCLAAAETRSFRDGEGFVRRVIRQECTPRAVRNPEAREGSGMEPVDPFLGRLAGPVLDAVRKLEPIYQNVIWKLASDHLSYAEIAREEGVKEGTLRSRAHWARRQAEKIMREAGQGAPALILFVPHRFRSTFARVVDGFTPQSFATTALVPLLALFAAPVPAVALSGTIPPPSRSAPVTLAAVAGPVQTAPRTPALRATEVVAIEVSPATTSPALAVAGRTAATETPDDVILTAIASPADGRPVLVALGKGKACNCSVLMQSMDGGATWESADGPPTDANQLVVPPNWPTDPRIFSGVGPVLGRHPYMSPGFGQPFAQLSALPAGQVAVSAHFDDGDPRLFLAGQTQLWSIRIGDASAVAHDEVDYSVGGLATGAVAAVATPAPSPGGPSLLAWTPPAAVVPASANPVSSDSTIMQCPVASPCSTVSSLPLVPWRLAMRGPRTVLAYRAGGAYVSHDAGVSFVSLPLPIGASTLESMTLGGRDSAPWVSFERADGSFGVARLVGAMGTWADAAGQSTSARTELGQLFAVGVGGIIEQFATAGYRCTTTAGAVWSPRCPAQ